MEEETNREIGNRRQQGLKDLNRHLFKIDPMAEYLVTLERDGNLKPIPKVTWALLKEMDKRRSEDLIKFRNCNYRLIDSERFEEIF